MLPRYADQSFSPYPGRKTETVEGRAVVSDLSAAALAAVLALVARVAVVTVVAIGVELVVCP
jgi:hypothetical protein